MANVGENCFFFYLSQQQSIPIGVGQSTYSQVWEVVREAPYRFSERLDDYGLHSFRAEGASATVNAGVKYWLFKDTSNRV